MPSPQDLFMLISLLLISSACSSFTETGGGEIYDNTEFTYISPHYNSDLIFSKPIYFELSKNSLRTILDDIFFESRTCESDSLRACFINPNFLSIVVPKSDFSGKSVTIGSMKFDIMSKYEEDCGNRRKDFSFIIQTKLEEKNYLRYVYSNCNGLRYFSFGDVNHDSNEFIPRISYISDRQNKQIKLLDY